MPNLIVNLTDLNLDNGQVQSPGSWRLNVAQETPSQPRRAILHKVNPQDCPAAATVLVGELYRLWSVTPQPCVQLVKTSVGGQLHTLTEEIEGAEPYFTATNHALTPAVQNEIMAKRTSGLASLSVIALTLGQGYLRKVFLTPANSFIHYDQDQSLGFFWEDIWESGCSFDFKKGDLETLPLLRNYAPFEWLDVEYLDDGLDFPVYGQNTALASLQQDRDFNTEKYQTLLRIILTPFSAITALADELIEDPNLKAFLLAKLKKRMLHVEGCALMLPAFRHFLYQQSVVNFTPFIRSVQDFPSINEQEFKLRCQLKFNSIKSEEFLEHYISAHEAMATVNKRFILENMIETLIKEARTFEAVMDAVRKMRDADTFRILKDRQTGFRISLRGDQHDGREVSKTYSNLLSKAKDKLISLAVAHAQLHDKSLLRTLANPDNCYGKFINVQRHRFFKQETASARSVRLMLHYDFSHGVRPVEMRDARQLAARDVRP